MVHLFFFFMWFGFSRKSQYIDTLLKHLILWGKKKIELIKTILLGNLVIRFNCHGFESFGRKFNEAITN